MANQYKNKVVYFGETLIDLSSDTVTAETLLEGYTAHRADGAVITGTYVPTSSAITVITTQDPNGGEVKEIIAVDISRDTVTAATLLQGYTAHDRLGNAITGTYVPSGSSIQANKNVTPTTSQQIITADTGYDAMAQVTVAAMPTGSVANPTITISSSGLITANAAITAGYVAAGTATATSQLTTKSAETIYPSTSDQTIASGRYLTGTQTIKAVVVTGLSAANVASGVTIKVGDSTDDDRIASVTGTLSFVTYRTGTGAPSNSLGVDGDIYLQTS